MRGYANIPNTIPAKLFLFMTVVTMVGVMVVMSSIGMQRIYNARSNTLPDCMDCIQVDREMTIKGFGNFRFPEPNCHGKLLVYECLGGDTCGGLADRQKGIMSAFLLALLTNRTFIVNHRKSCVMKRLMLPRVYNWYKCMPSLGRFGFRGTVDVRYIDAKGYLPSNFSTFPVGDLWVDHIVTVHLNTRLNSAIKGHPDASRKLPWLLSAPDHVVLTGLMKVLFKPEESLETHLSGFIRKTTDSGKKKLVGVHIRTFFLQVDKDIPVFFNFLEQYNDSSRFMIYFATDDVEIKNQAANLFPNFISLDNQIVHIDNTDRACQGMYTAVFEQHVLARSDVLILSPSGFSRMAAFIRESSENLFLFMGRTEVDEAHLKQVTLKDLVEMHPLS